MIGDTYVSDPILWKDFYRSMLNEKFVPEQYGRKQRGGGIAQLYTRKPYMIPVNPHTEEKKNDETIVGAQVTPVAAVEERAKSELKDEIQKRVPHVPIGKKNKKLNQKKKAISRKRKVQSSTSQPKRGRKTKSSKKKSKKSQKKNLKRKIQSPHNFNIFNKKRRI